MSGLVEAMREEFGKIFNGEGKLIVNKSGQLDFVEFKIGGEDVFYYVGIGKDVFITNEISILPDEDEEIFNKVVGMNESVAKKLGCLQINTEALDDDDKTLLQRQGYEFGDDKYLGVKKLK